MEQDELVWRRRSFSFFSCGRGKEKWPGVSSVVSRSQTLHAEGKVGSGQLTLSRLFRFPEIIRSVNGSVNASAI